MKNLMFRLPILALLFSIIISCSSDSNPVSDPCPPITCLNGGSFVDCACDCTQGYEGVNCSIQVEPLRIKITKVTIKAFPSLDITGDFWDLPIPTIDEVYPDIYFQILDDNFDILYDSPTFFLNADLSNGNYFEFIPSPVITLTDYLSLYLFEVYDYDATSNDDFMVTKAFDIYTINNGFPNVITLTQTNPTLLVDLELSYQW